jgi:hypothetical protein
MPIEVEVSLKIPRVRIPAADQYRDHTIVDNSTVRFTKRMHVPSIPKVGVSLELTTQSGQPFEGVVMNAEWHEGTARFILSCRYAARSMSADAYDSLIRDADWHVKQLGVG